MDLRRSTFPRGTFESVVGQVAQHPRQVHFTVSCLEAALRRGNVRLVRAVPLTLLIIAALLFLATSSVFRVAVVMLAVPFSLVGGLAPLAPRGYHLSGASA